MVKRQQHRVAEREGEDGAAAVCERVGMYTFDEPCGVVEEEVHSSKKRVTCRRTPVERPCHFC